MSRLNPYVLVIAVGALLSITGLLFFSGEDVNWVFRYGIHVVSLAMVSFAVIKVING